MKFAVWTVIVAFALTAATSTVKAIPTENKAKGFNSIARRRTLNTTSDAVDGDDSGGIDYLLFSFSLDYTTSDFDFGTQWLQFIIDTARADTWVADENCDSCQLNLYRTEWSPTYKKTGDNFKLDFVDINGSTTLTGSLGTDDFYDGDGIGGNTIKDVRFGIANIKKDRPLPYLQDNSGVIGLGRQKQDKKAVGSTFLSAFIKTGAIKKNMFGIRHDRVDKKNSLRLGALTVGGVDNDYAKGLQYHPLLPETDAWEIGLKDVLLNGDSLGYQRTALFDTTSWTLRVPEKDAKEIFQKIPGSKPDKNGIYKIPRNSNVVIALKFSDKEYSMKAGDICYNDKESDKEPTCEAAIQAGDTEKWIIGHPFLINVYAVFDEDNKRIGIAQRPDY